MNLLSSANYLVSEVKMNSSPSNLIHLFIMYKDFLHTLLFHPKKHLLIHRPVCLSLTTYSTLFSLSCSHIKEVSFYDQFQVKSQTILHSCHHCQKTPTDQTIITTKKCYNYTLAQPFIIPSPHCPFLSQQTLNKPALP